MKSRKSLLDQDIKKRKGKHKTVIENELLKSLIGFNLIINCKTKGDKRKHKFILTMNQMYV